MLSEEATNTNCIVFGLTWPRPEPTIYHTGGEHENHYATDAINSKIQMLFEPWFENKTEKINLEFKIYICFT
jgi:hypothetical protein